MSNPVDSLGNVKVDFVWGNMPMQPDDARGDNTLDPALDNHIIATSGYEGFPAFIRGGDYDDTVPNTTVPDVSGLTESAANSALVAASLVKGTVSTTEDGATSENDGKVKLQSIASGAVVNTGTAVDLLLFSYVAP